MANQNETTNNTASNMEPRDFPAKVAKVVDEYTVVINRGTDDGVQKGQTYLIYGIEDEVTDPETGESLGHLEVVRGRGSVTHLQARMATVKASQKTSSRVVKRKNMGLLSIGAEVVEESNEGTTIPFDEVLVGDHAKPL